MNPWAKFWAYYLLHSVRFCCYCSNLYFYSVLSSFLNNAIRIPYISEILIILYSAACFHFVTKIIDRKYKPRFISEEQAKISKPIKENDVLILNKESYEYRTHAEKIIYQCALFFLINFCIALFLVLVAFGGDQRIGKTFGGALIGLFASISTFVGAAVISSAVIMEDKNKNFNPAPFFFGLPFVIPPLVYIVISVYLVFF